MTSTRSDLHQLVDQLGEADLAAANEALTGLVQRAGSPPPPRRRFRFTAGMDAEPDLATRSAEILRDELGRRG